MCCDGENHEIIMPIPISLMRVMSGEMEVKGVSKIKYSSFPHHVEVDLLPEPPLADLAGERPLLLVHQVDVLVQARLARALVLANRASGREGGTG